MIAQYFFNAIMNRDQFHTTKLDWHDLEPSSVSNVGLLKRPGFETAFKWEDIYFNFDKGVDAYIERISLRVRKPGFTRKLDAVAIVSLKPRDVSVLNANYLPLDFLPNHGDVLGLIINGKLNPLGSLVFPIQGVPIGYVKFNKSVDEVGYFPFGELRQRIDILKIAKDYGLIYGDSIVLSIGNKKVFEVFYSDALDSKALRFQQKGRQWQIKPLGGRFIDTKNLPQNGIFSLGINQGSESFEFPFSKWSRNIESHTIDLTKLESYIEFIGDRAVIKQTK